MSTSAFFVITDFDENVNTYVERYGCKFKPSFSKMARYLGIDLVRYNKKTLSVVFDKDVDPASIPFFDINKHQVEYLSDVLYITIPDTNIVFSITPKAIHIGHEFVQKHKTIEDITFVFFTPIFQLLDYARYVMSEKQVIDEVTSSIISPLTYFDGDERLAGVKNMILFDKDGSIAMKTYSNYQNNDLSLKDNLKKLYLEKYAYDSRGN